MFRTRAVLHTFMIFVFPCGATEELCTDSSPTQLETNSLLQSKVVMNSAIHSQALDVAAAINEIHQNPIHASQMLQDFATSTMDTAGIAHEISTAFLTHDPINIPLPAGVGAPVLIAGPPTFVGADTAVVRLQLVGDHFSVWIGKPQCNDDVHVREDTGYAVFDKGQDADHAVGTVEVGADWVTVPLPDLGPYPFVFTQSQSGQKNNGVAVGYAVTRNEAMDEVSSREFKISIQIDEFSGVLNHDQSNVEVETVGFLAVRSDCLDHNNCGCQTDHSTCRMRNGYTTINGKNVRYEIGLVWSYNTSVHSNTNSGPTIDRTTPVQFKAGHFMAQPIILVSMQSFRGNNPANIRIATASKDSFEFLVDEDECRDSERQHIEEWVAYYALEEVVTTTTSTTTTSTTVTTTTAAMVVTTSTSTVAEPYKDLGTGKCQTLTGGDPLHSYIHNGGNACQESCNVRQDCFGYSVSNHQNCLLWLQPDIKGGGPAWGDAHCHKKVVPTPFSCEMPSHTATTASNMGWANDWDAHFKFECPAGEAISSLYSVHDNHREDRRWKFACGQLSGGSLGRCTWGAYTAWDGTWTLGSEGDVITGIESQHDNHKEDRQYKIKSCKLMDATVKAVHHDIDWRNDFDGQLSSDLPGQHFLTQITSHHDNWKEDRQFKFSTVEFCKAR